MRHPQEICRRYWGKTGMQELAAVLRRLRYDVLYWLLLYLSQYMAEDAKADFHRGRPKLGGCLQRASGYLAGAAREISEAWRISKPYEESKCKEEDHA